MEILNGLILIKCKTFESIPPGGDTGFIFEVDFEYPETSHHLHYDFLLLAINQKHLKGKYSKLLLTLEVKERYTDHYTTIQQSNLFWIEHYENLDVVQQKEELVINDLYHLTVDSNACKIIKHGKILPHTVRCIISGSSNVEKTNDAFNLLTKPNDVHFNNVYVFSKSLNQPKYQLLEKISSNIPETSYFKTMKLYGTS